VAGFNPKTFRTLEFLLLVVSNLAAWLLVIVDYIPDRFGIYASAASGALYGLWRGLAKANADTRDYWHTTEFWVAVLASAPVIIGAFADTIHPTTFGILQTGIIALTGIAMGIRKEPNVAAGNLTALDAQGLEEAERDLFVPDVGHDPSLDHDDSILAVEHHEAVRQVEAEVAAAEPGTLGPEFDTADDEVPDLPDEPDTGPGPGTPPPTGSGPPPPMPPPPPPPRRGRRG
jgi:hypothetical protein